MHSGCKGPDRVSHGLEWRDFANFQEGLQFGVHGFSGSGGRLP